ncbi:hypothetical protein PHYPSEUDO_002255 [Phytophthora pseudosyringae]|uniref:Uncharacterized protein n=1 Tax=Phytophthora pseudosyringae TaxID=221518 RepID=A0A8T1VUU4_9STRA|nr:hypothetical protein PHYPSEUDO_002255 [Phytophthora pseudosyringae]
MATSCSGVTTCLSEGSTECDLKSETCPPCVYALTGGDYSCYSRDTSGACPFSGAYAECDQSTTTSTGSKSSSSKDSGSSSDTTPTPTTKTPAKTPATEAPTEAPTSAPATPTTGTSDSTSSSQTTSDGTAATTDATAAPSPASTASRSSDATQTSYTPSSDSGAEKALTSNTAATSGSPAVVNLALIGGAVVLAVIVLAFVARRVVKKKKMAATQEHTVSSGHNSAWSDRTLGTGTSGGNLYSTYSYKDKGDGISMLSDSQASSTYGPAAYHGHPGSEQRPTADFSAYGGDSQYAENSQFYSVSTGPELLAAGAVAGAGHNHSNDGAPPATQAGNHFVDVTATSTSMRESELDSLRSGQQPLTVSQLMPTAIEEDEEGAYATRRQPGTQQYGVAHPTTYNFQIANAAVPPSSRKPQIFGTSATSSMRSDYDIVDPITMRDVEARNTETLAEDGRYPKFSFESEASSADLYDGDSSEEESSGDERVGHGEEHTI